MRKSWSRIFTVAMAIPIAPYVPRGLRFRNHWQW